MANKLSPADIEQGATKTHNVQARKAIMQECADSILDIRKRRRALNEEAGDIRKRLKDSGIDIEAFNHAVRLLERDQDQREAWLDAIRETYIALGIGQQLDFLEAAGTA